MQMDQNLFKKTKKQTTAQQKKCKRIFQSGTTNILLTIMMIMIVVIQRIVAIVLNNHSDNCICLLSEVATGGVLKNYAKFTGKHLSQSLLIKLQAASFFTEHVGPTASVLFLTHISLAKRVLKLCKTISCISSTLRSEFKDFIQINRTVAIDKTECYCIYAMSS